MKLYLLLCSLDQRLADVMPPSTADGVQLRDLEPAAISSIDRASTTVHNDQLPLGDRLITSSSELVVSQRAKETLQQFASNNYLSFAPVHVWSRDRKRHLAQYYYAIAAHEIDAIDYEASQFEHFHTLPNKIRGVTTWVFRKDAVPRFGVFRSPFLSWFGTQELVDAIQRCRLTGFRCTKAWED